MDLPASDAATITRLLGRWKGQISSELLLREHSDASSLTLSVDLQPSASATSTAGRVGVAMDNDGVGNVVQELGSSSDEDEDTSSGRKSRGSGGSDRDSNAGVSTPSSKQQARRGRNRRHPMVLEDDSDDSEAELLPESMSVDGYSRQQSMADNGNTEAVDVDPSNVLSGIAPEPLDSTEALTVAELSQWKDVDWI